MHGGLVTRKVSVRLSVRLSNAWIVTNGKKSVQIFIPYERYLQYLLRRRMIGGGGRPLLPEILDQPAPLK